MRGLNGKLALAVMMLAIGPMALAQDRSPAGTANFAIKFQLKTLSTIA